MQKYINKPLSRYDLKLIANEINEIDTTKKKVKLIPFTLGEIKILLLKQGYKLHTVRYYNGNRNKMMYYYIIN